MAARFAQVERVHYGLVDLLVHLRRNTRDGLDEMLNSVVRDDEDADAAATVADDAAVTSSDMACLGVVLEILLVMFKHTNHSLIHATY